MGLGIFIVVQMGRPKDTPPRRRFAKNRTLSSGDTRRKCPVRDESRAHYARDSSGQLRRILDLVNRAIRRGVIGSHRDGGYDNSTRKIGGLGGRDGSLKTDAATIRNGSRIMLVVASGRIVLLGLITAGKNANLFCKAHHRMREKN